MDVTAPLLSRQTGLLSELNTIANNIANVGTTGYKREGGVFAEFVQRVPTEESRSLGALRGHYANFSDGGMIATGGDLDVALSGPGFFGVLTPNGIRLTRDGAVQLDSEGNVVTAAGMPVVSQGGRPITVPPEGTSIEIASDGTISVDGFVVDQFGVFVANPAALVREGENLWQPTQGYQIADEPNVLQGFLEQSNVSAVMETARLVEAQRLFEIGQSLLDDDHRKKEEMINVLGGRR